MGFILPILLIMYSLISTFSSKKIHTAEQMAIHSVQLAVSAMLAIITAMTLAYIFPPKSEFLSEVWAGIIVCWVSLSYIQYTTADPMKVRVLDVLAVALAVNASVWILIFWVVLFVGQIEHTSLTAVSFIGGLAGYGLGAWACGVDIKRRGNGA